MRQKYLTTPLPSSDMPAGIPYIVGNEAAERFSFYGMRAILVIFMTQYLLAADGSKAVMNEEQAKYYFHLFVMSAYFFPVLGAVISDALLGKYRTILYLSVVYCLGHLSLALDETRLGLFLGLSLIAIGSGGIKPCVSAHVGDQFGQFNQHLLSRVFGWFYFSINLGAFTSMLLTPVLLRDVGPNLAFGVPGLLMFLATLIFWMGRHRFVHVPPGGVASLKEAISGEGLTALRNMIMIYVFVAMFWSLFDQTGSAWVLQARRMDRQWLGIQWLPSQIGAVNSVLVLAFIPLFSYVVYPAIDRLFPLTPLRKVSIGLFLTVPAFAIPAWIEGQISGGQIVTATSRVDDQWTAENLLDGKTDGSGWVSAKQPEFPQEIVVELRERKSWQVSSVALHPYTDLKSLLADSQQQASAASSADCWARQVEILAGPSRKGPWSRLGSILLQQTEQFQVLEFSPVATRYVMLRIHSNWGGDFVSLGEVEVRAAESSVTSDDTRARDVWPNLAASGFRPNIVWQLLAYVFLTAAEIMVSITCLEFSYTQAPRKMKSFIMSLYLLSISAGNAFTSAVNFFIQNDDGSSKLEGASYYWFFTGVIFAAALGFIVVAKTYRGKTYIQDQD